MHFIWSTRWLLLGLCIVALLTLTSSSSIGMRVYGLVFIYEIQGRGLHGAGFNITNLYDPSLLSLLTNYLLFFHPPMLYFSSLLLIGAYCYIHIRGWRRLFSPAHSFVYARKHSASWLSITGVTLFLGMWWAFCMGTWGGWWNWDISELFLLILFSHALHEWHSGLGITIYARYTRVNIRLFILLLYGLLQLWLSQTAHSFMLWGTCFETSAGFYLCCVISGITASLFSQHFLYQWRFICAWSGDMYMQYLLFGFMSIGGGGASLILLFLFTEWGGDTFISFLVLGLYITCIIYYTYRWTGLWSLGILVREGFGNVFFTGRCVWQAIHFTGIILLLGVGFSYGVFFFDFIDSLSTRGIYRYADGVNQQNQITLTYVISYITYFVQSTIYGIGNTVTEIYLLVGSLLLYSIYLVTYRVTVLARV